MFLNKKRTSKSGVKTLLSSIDAYHKFEICTQGKAKTTGF
ncbi:MAG: hypothetical protein RIS64_1151 [Bacteroidota bacterium]|jgi:hypothetical protein